MLLAGQRELRAPAPIHQGIKIPPFKRKISIFVNVGAFVECGEKTKRRLRDKQSKNVWYYIPGRELASWKLGKADKRGEVEGAKKLRQHNYWDNKIPNKIRDESQSSTGRASRARCPAKKPSRRNADALPGLPLVPTFRAYYTVFPR